MKTAIVRAPHNVSTKKCACGMEVINRPYYLTVDGHPTCVLCADVYHAGPEYRQMMQANEVDSLKGYEYDMQIMRAREARGRLLEATGSKKAV